MGFPTTNPCPSPLPSPGRRARTGNRDWRSQPAPSAPRWAGWLLAGVLLVFSLAPWTTRGSTLSGRVRTVQRLGTAKDLGEPRAFVKGNDARLYFTNTAAGGWLVFKAAWKHTPLQAWDYTYHAAVLRFDRNPPKLPSLTSPWREARVLGREKWSAFAAAATERLTPRTPGHGIYFQTLESDRVLYRDAAGQVKALPFGNEPAEVVIDRRLNAQEFTLALARAMESQLQSAFPGTRLFLIAHPLAGHEETGFCLLDVGQRRCVLFSAPHIDADVGGGFPLDYSLRSLASLTIESHGFGILKNPVSAAGRLVNMAVQTVSGLFTPVLHSTRPPDPTPGDGDGMDLAAWENHLDHLTGMPRDYGTVQFLINGENFFPTLEQRLAEARQKIHLHVAIFDTDDVAVGIADELRAKSTNVQVRVLLDRMSSLASGVSPPATPMPDGFVPPKSIGTYLEHHSRVAVRPFLNPWFTADHTKVITIDGRYAFLGGMNIGREYRYEWHDLMAEIEGPVVAHFERDFDRAWAHASALGDLAYLERTLSGKRPHPPAAETRKWPEIRRLYTRTGNTQIRRAEMEAFDWARKRIYLENPYLFDRSVLIALIQARERGVDVRVVLPSENDLAGGRSSNFVIANHLFRNGIRVYLYPGMTHVKALLVDGWVCFGSANFDKLGLRLNQEADIASSDADIVTRLRNELFEVDFAKSHLLTRPLEVNWTDDLADQLLSQF